MIITILITIYLVSALLIWLYFHLAYSKNGIFRSIDSDFSDIMFMFLPILNTF